MQIALRHLVLLALALPGLLAGRGANLVVCYCDIDVDRCALEAAPSGACDAGCCAPEEEREDGPTVEAAPCPGCHHLSVDEVDLALTVEHSVALAPAPAATRAPVADGPDIRLRNARPPIGRAPPGVVRPPALLPGVLPLRV